LWKVEQIRKEAGLSVNAKIVSAYEDATETTEEGSKEEDSVPAEDANAKF